MLSLLLFALISDSATIHTTVSDNSSVSFIARVPLTWETVEHDSLRYIRFNDSPLSDSIGYPELPMITCLVAVPDSVTPELEYSISNERILSVLPVYPSPAHIISNEFTPDIIDSFVQDSTAYSSNKFWPSERVRIIGEIKICDQRLLQVQCFPAQYRAADSSLSVVSSFSVTVNFDSSEAIWSNTGLGHFQRMVSGSPIVGYSPIAQSHAPVPVYFGEVDPEDGPSRMPEYLIICASGLYTQSKAAIDTLGEHRAFLNGFDVALVTTDSILADFGGSATAITSTIIRDFTEHMWSEWGDSTSNTTPAYLLLIGDHEDPEFSDEPWFLPTHLYPYNPETLEYFVGNDEWYTYFNQPDSVNNAFPEMSVGRLSLKNGTTPATDTLSTIIYNLIDLEDPITQVPFTDYRRRILRLAGTGQSDSDTTFKQSFGYLNTPLSPWTSDFANWLNYDYTSHYCGDGRSFTDCDSSTMSSKEWVDSCLVELNRGAGVAFYTNHGALHMFSAGLEWCPWLINDPRHTKGARDSTFNNYQIENYLNNPVSSYSAPFLLSLSCSNGTFNHTIAEHRGRISHTYFCHDDGSDTGVPPEYDFTSDCLAEKLLKNTDAPVAGVFAGSEASSMISYEYYGKGIIEAIYTRGEGRLGDAIASSRFQYEDYFTNSDGSYCMALGQFNLLGDPALDISDRVRFPQNCDLLIYQNDVTISEYPVETSSNTILPFTFTIFNNGAQASGAFNTKVTFESGLNLSTINISCASIAAGDSAKYEEEWTCPAWFSAPRELQVTIKADDGDDCSDSWRGNNTSTISIQLNDTYPVDTNWIDDFWIKSINEVLTTTPILVDLDTDDELEVVIACGSRLLAYEDDGTLKWELSGLGLSSSVQPLAADLDQDGEVELLLATGTDGIKVISHEGRLLSTLTGVSYAYVVGDLHRRTGLELCSVDWDTGKYLKLYYWENNRMNLLATKDLGYSGGRRPVSLVVAGICGNTFNDVIYLNGGRELSFPATEEKTSIEVYNWDTSIHEYTKTWNEYINSRDIRLSAGTLSDIGSIGYPLGEYDSSGDPAMIFEPDETSPEISCDSASVLSSLNINYGVFADWAAGAGVDAFVLPSERQCMAWNVDGLALDNFPTAEFSGASEGSSISPTALGNLDSTTVYDDVLFSTLLDGNWVLKAFVSGTCRLYHPWHGGCIPVGRFYGTGGYTT